MDYIANLIDSLQSPFDMVVIIILVVVPLGVLSGVISTISTQVRKFACHHKELELKREMIDRGMTSEEIARIISATGERDSKNDDQ